MQFDKRIRSQNLRAMGGAKRLDAARAENCFLYRKKPERMPPTNIEIYCEPERGRYFMHPINVTLRNLNYIVRTLFKNGKDQQALVASSAGASSDAYQVVLPRGDKSAEKSAKKE